MFVIRPIHVRERVAKGRAVARAYLGCRTAAGDDADVAYIHI